MYKKKIDEDIRCPLEYGLSVLGGKWNSRIICLLNSLGDLRFSQIQSEMVSISDGVLGNTLKALIHAGMIEKKTSISLSGDTTTENKVYGLTDKGRSVVPIYRELCKWSSRYFQDNGSIVMIHCQKCEFYQDWGGNRDAQM